MFANISVNDVISVLQLHNEGARQVAYFGSQAYSYGKISHPPKEYPDANFFTEIFEKISNVDPTFTRENFSCMVNYYPTGDSFINQHSDNEWAIDINSNIYTISLGSPRTVKYINQKGPLDIRLVTLLGGSVSCMSARSQLEWTHGIESDPSVTEPRVSLTFRHKSSVQPPARKRAPPVRGPTAHPAEKVLKPSCAPPGHCSSDHSRILFLTDSILSGCQPQMFKDLSGYTTIKKTNYDMCNFINYKDEFLYTDIVVISGGINDLARNGHSAESLADVVLPRLEKCSKDFPNTKFVINSVIMTNQRHINEHGVRFNGYLSNFCTHFSNMIFFDSHKFMLDHHHKLAGNIYNQLDANGIHITPQACRMIGEQLVWFIKRTCISYLTRYSCAPVGRRSWPVR